MDSRIQKMAAIIVNYSTRVQAGERVLFRGTSPLAQPLLQAMTAEALKVGARPFNYVHMSQEAKIILENGAIDQIETENPMLRLMYDTADVIVRVEAEEDTKALAGFPTEKIQARGRALGGLLATQMRREGDKSLRRCTTLFPTESYARDAGMTLKEYEDFVFGACMVEHSDPVSYWNAMRDDQQRLVEYLRGKKALHIRGKNIDMTMSIDGRIFENASGQANFPDGEIFTGPVETSVNGWVKFTFPAIYGGNVVKGAELRFENGVVTHAAAQEGEAFLKAVLDTDAGARRLGEFAIGTNRGVDRFTGQILFDEKIHGTVHMAVGKGYPFTGSVNDSAVHWDMICDMRDGGEILVDGVLFYKDGEFLLK